jgi:hypothetical protein
MSRPEQDHRRSLPLLTYLGELGKDHDRFFTLEEAWKEGEPINKVEGVWAESAAERKSFDQELRQLVQTIPRLRYKIDQTNVKIVHLIDERLADQQGYGIEGELRSIDFTGKVDDLVSEIRRQGSPVSRPLLMDTREFLDHETVVHVRGERLKVRAALTDFVPLQGRVGRILWIARTKLGRGETTYVYYPYPGKGDVR